MLKFKIFYAIQVVKEFIKSTVIIASIITALVLFVVLLQTLYKPKIRIVNGHEYIVFPSYNNDDVEHSPECNKCQSEQNLN